jgi:hypothetical protein
MILPKAEAGVKVDVGGKIEIDYVGKEDELTLGLGDVEVSFDADIGEKVAASIILRVDKLWEKGKAALDEVIISLRGLEIIQPFSLTVGITEMPFGIFETHLITDTWTKEWEVDDYVGVIASFVEGPNELKLAIYDANMEEECLSFASQLLLFLGKGLFAAVSYRTQEKKDEILSDLHFYFQYIREQLTIDLERCWAVKRKGDLPSSWSFGIAYEVKESLEVALRYDIKSKNTAEESDRIGIGANYELFGETTLSVEYGSVKEKGKDRKGECLARLSVEF